MIFIQDYFLVQTQKIILSATAVASTGGSPVASSSKGAATSTSSVPAAPLVEDFNSISSQSGGGGSLKKVKRKSPRIRGSSSTGNVEKRPRDQQHASQQQPQQPVREALSPSVAESIRAVFAAFVWHEG